MSALTNGGRARSYQALRESEELHRATLSQISDAVFLTDDDGAFTYICPNVDVIFGYVPDEVQAMARIDRLLGENLFDRAELAACGEIRNIEREVQAKSGERRTVLVLIKQVAIKGGTVLYTCRDVTERKQAEEELRAARLDLTHASRLALIGELMASISHEINQPLTSILGNATAGLRYLDDARRSETVDFREIFSDLRDQARVAAQTIERLRRLARKRPLEVRTLAINDIAIDMLKFIEGDARRRGITVRADLTPALPTIDADRASLQQVVLNLLLNAMDAMDFARAGEHCLTLQTLQRAVDTVEVAVSDTGTGISSEGLPKLFDAFFTTKHDGVGLGLSIARSIVEAHRGRIWAEDRGGGATFRFTLPVSAQLRRG